MEYPTISEQSQLIGAGLNPNAPATTYVDFATQMAKNQRDQAEMEQNLALAKQRVAQGIVTTQQMQEAQKRGVNPLLINMISRDQAKAYLDAIIEARKIKIDPKTIEAWYNTLPQMVNREDIEAFATTAAKTPTLGSSMLATGKPGTMTKDGVSYNTMSILHNGNVVTATKRDPVDGIWIYPFMVEEATPEEKAEMQERADRAVEVKSGMQAKYDTQQDINTKRRWSQFQDKLNINTVPGARAAGMASINNVRAQRALTRLQSTSVTQQDLEIVANDLAAIFKGGVPDIESQRHQRYPTLDGEFSKIAQFILSKPIEAELPEIVKRLRTITNELVDVDNTVLKNHLDSVVTGYEDLIKQDPARFARMVNAQLRQMGQPTINLKVVENMDEVPISHAVVDSLEASSAEPKPTKESPEITAKRDTLRKKLMGN